MSRDGQSPLDDLIGACEKIEAFADGCTEQEFRKRALIWSAVAYQMIVLGEASKRLDQEIRARFANITWKDVIGMRDILSHKYDTIDLEELWDTVQRDIPKLWADLREIQSALLR